MEGCDWEAFGPHLVMQPGGETFSTGVGAGAFLEVVLEQPSYVGGVVICCPARVTKLRLLLLKPSSVYLPSDSKLNFIELNDDSLRQGVPSRD